jgi:membrane fusion protein, multidrug efflux system
VIEGGKILSIGRKRATEALLMSAQEDLNTEREELARVEKLVQSGAIPKDQLDLSRSKHSRMVAQLEKVKENSDDYDIVAPWNGIVAKVLVADGNYVSARSPLVEVFDPDSLVVRMAVPEAHSQDIRQNMDVGVKLDAYPGKTFQGKIVRIYPELDRRMRTRTAEVEITDNAPLIPGMFARLSLKLKSEKETVVVPTEAVIVTPKGFRVAYVIENNKAVQRKINTGIEGVGKVQVLSGVKQGEQLVVAGNEKLKDGLEIRLQGGLTSGADNSAKKGSSDKGIAVK